MEGIQGHYGETGNWSGGQEFTLPVQWCGDCYKLSGLSQGCRGCTSSSTCKHGTVPLDPTPEKHDFRKLIKEALLSPLPDSHLAAASACCARMLGRPEGGVTLLPDTPSFAVACLTFMITEPSARAVR